VAEHEINRVALDNPRTLTVHAMLASTVIYEQVLTALHRLAQEDASARRFAPELKSLEGALDTLRRLAIRR